MHLEYQLIRETSTLVDCTENLFNSFKLVVLRGLSFKNIGESDYPVICVCVKLIINEFGSVNRKINENVAEIT